MASKHARESTKYSIKSLGICSKHTVTATRNKLSESKTIRAINL